MVWGGDKKGEEKERVSKMSNKGLGGNGRGYEGVSEGDVSGCASGSTGFYIGVDE